MINLIARTIPHRRLACFRHAQKFPLAFPTLLTIDEHTPTMSIADTLKASISRAERLENSRLSLRNHLWPHVTPDRLWSRKSAKGFATVPRTLPLIMQIMDRLNVGKPVSSVY